MGRDQYHPKWEALGIVGRLLRSEHHGDIDVAGEVGQPLGVTGIREACEMESVLVGGRRDDGVDLAAEGELYRGLNGVAGDAAGANQPFAVRFRVTTAQPPCTDGDAPLSRYFCDLVFRADNRDLGFERLDQGAGDDLGSDASGVTQR